MANVCEKLHGIIVPLLTPFSNDGRVDEKSLQRLANYVVDGGVNGVFVMGTTGEFQFVSFEQQRAAVEVVVDAVGDRSLVVAGVTAKSVEETTRNVTVIGGLSKPPHALVIAPLCYHSNRNLPGHLERLSSISKVPILLYNNIGIVSRRWKRKDIIPSLLGRMATRSNIVGIKDSSGNLSYLTQILRYQSATFRCFQGEERAILPAFQKGVVGAVPSMGNILPRLFTTLYSAYSSGEMETAEACQHAIHQIHVHYPNDSSIPPILKAYLVRLGIIANPMSHFSLNGDADSILAGLESALRKLDQRYV